MQSAMYKLQTNIGLAMKKGKRYTSAFDALENDPIVASNLKIRARLMISLEREINRQELTQKAAAVMFGVSQPRISDLMKGKIDKFSIDMLVNMLAALGKDVRIQAA